MFKEIKSEFTKQATYIAYSSNDIALDIARETVRSYLEHIATVDYGNSEAAIIANKGRPENFNESELAQSPYQIEITREIGTNVAKDESFADYLKDIFGTKNVAYKTARCADKVDGETAGNPSMETLTFFVYGDDMTMKKRVEKRINAKKPHVAKAK